MEQDYTPPIAEIKPAKGQVLEKNEVDFSCSSIHNLSKNSIDDTKEVSSKDASEEEEKPAAPVEDTFERCQERVTSHTTHKSEEDVKMLQTQMEVFTTVASKKAEIKEIEKEVADMKKVHANALSNEDFDGVIEAEEKIEELKKWITEKEE